jgi:hypothetical protein
MTTGADWIDQGRRLLDAFLQGAAPAADPTSDAADATPQHSDCTWCPLCQVAAVLRGERPEVNAALADVLDTAATALRTFAAAGADPQPATGTDAGDADPPPAVQQIDIA